MIHYGLFLLLSLCAANFDPCTNLEYDPMFSQVEVKYQGPLSSSKNHFPWRVNIA